ncbi:MAG: glycosyltransferase, partial [Chitinophagaceae bacterium]
MALVYIFILLFIFYSILVIYYWRVFISIPEPKDLDLDLSEEISSVYISVIIPARNEEENIGILLKALQEQTYPTNHFEIIVINDHSTDKTQEIVSQFPGVKLLDLKEDAINSYKKKAIEIGIAAASGELIVTTDADCVPAPTWLQTIANFKLKTKAGFIVAPVVFDYNSSLVQTFQAVDFMILQGITAAAVYQGMHSMCNGANLAYEKKLIYDVHGCHGIDDIASGDDMLLMHKIAKKYPGRIQY